MERALYTSISAALEPLVMAHLFSRKCRGLEHPTRWKERLGYPSLPRPSGTLIWFHAVSLGEGLSAIPIIDRCLQIHPFVNVLLTTGTLTAFNVLRSKLSHGVIFQFVPVDTPTAVDRFLSHWKPQAGIFMESELWPNLLLSSSSRKIPMALLNARVSEKSFIRWSRFTSKSLVGEMLGSFSLICPLSTNDAIHLQLLGASPGVIHFSGNSKYAWGASQDKSQVEDLLLMKRKVWLASSTHAGEEEGTALFRTYKTPSHIPPGALVIAEVHLTLKRTFPEILTILAPRQPSRAESIMMMLRTHGLKVAQRSINENICLNTDIYLADTVGEFTRLYNSVPIAVVGGSLLKGLAGHNMAEAAACGCAVLTGTHLGHFSKMLKEMQSISPLSILQVSSADSLASALMELFSDEGGLRLRRKAAKAASTTAAAGIIDNIFKLLELNIFQGVYCDTLMGLGFSERKQGSMESRWEAKFQQLRTMVSAPKMGPPPAGRRMMIPKAQKRMKIYDLDEALIMYKKFRDIVKLRDLLEMSQGHVLNLHALGRLKGRFKLDPASRISSYPDAHPGVVKLTTDADSWKWLEFTDEAEDLIAEKGIYMREVHEAQVVKWIRKMLMMSQTRSMPLIRLQHLRNVLFLPPDFKSRIIHAYPQYFRVTTVRGALTLELVEWDESLAVTYREQRLRDNALELDELMGDTNPHAFPMSFPTGFHLRKNVREYYETFQKLPFQSPYEICRTIHGTMEAEKRNLAIVHEILSMYVEKRAQIAQIAVFRKDFKLMSSLRGLIERHQGIFYTSYKEDLFTVFLKEAYSGMRLIDRSPLLDFRDRFIRLCLIQPREKRLDPRRTSPENVEKRLRQMDTIKEEVGRMDCEGKISCKGSKREMRRCLASGHEVEILGEDRNARWRRPRVLFEEMMDKTPDYNITELEKALYRFKGKADKWPNREDGSCEGLDDDDDGDSDFEW